MRRFLVFWGVFLLIMLGSVGMKGQTVFGEEQIISTNALGARDVHAADLDGDGDMDILSASWDIITSSWDDSKIAWYENEGNDSFTEHIIMKGNFNIDGANSVYAVDLDKDGDMDVLSASLLSSLVLWHENDGYGNFSDGSIVLYAYGATDIYPVDLDNDDDIDVLSCSFHGDRVVMGKNDGNENFDYERLSISDAEGVVSVHAADLDLDGDIDVLSASSHDDIVGWYKNKGDGSFSNIVRLDTDADGANSVYAADLDNDGDLDVLAASRRDKTIAWYRSAGNGAFSNKIIISKTVNNASVVYAADLDNDEDMDVLSASFDDDRIVWYENDGYGNFSSPYLITTNADEVSALYVADVDGDGDNDVLSASSGDNKIAWYQNLFVHNPIQVFTFYDLNENGLYEETEYSLSNKKILLQPDDKVSFTNSQGYLSYFVTVGEYELSYGYNPLWKLTSTPETYFITTNENTEFLTYPFGFYPTRIFNQVVPHLSSSPTRCSQEVTYWLHYTNTGTTLANGTITLEVDELMEFISSNPEPDLIEGRTLTWNIRDLPPSFENKISLQFQMPDFNSIGEILETQASLQLVNENDELVYTKSTAYASEVRCSYDPNDKLSRSNLLGQAESAYIRDTLLYTVRFQNTGNDVAFNIRVEDILDKKLDWTTFHPITASHEYHTELNRETGLITFHFDDIMLPDSTSNEVESHGFVTFGVASLTDLEDKTEVENTASIFFDFNPPIITNTVSNVLIEFDGVGIESLEGDDTIQVFPNPFSDFTTIALEGLPEGEYQLQLVDILGRKVRELKMGNGKMKIDRKNLENGVYLFRIESIGGEFVGSGKVLVE